MNINYLKIILTNSKRLTEKLRISLRYIEIIYPVIPSFGTKKKMNVVLIIRSNMFIIITPTCASSPRRMLSITVSTYIKIASGAKSLI